MKTLFAPLALAALALPGAAFAAEGEMEKCCCEKMKQEGRECCAKDDADHGEDHAGHGEDKPEAPAN